MNVKNKDKNDKRPSKANDSSTEDQDGVALNTQGDDFSESEEIPEINKNASTDSTERRKEEKKVHSR